MSVLLTINGQEFAYPEVNDVEWGADATDWAVAVTNGMLQKEGGLFLLLDDVDFGTNFGLISKYFTSRTANSADAGAVRLANTDSVAFRNFANDNNLLLGVSVSDTLTFNGSAIGNFVTVSDTSTIDLTLLAGDLSAAVKALSITNSFIANSTIDLTTKVTGILPIANGGTGASSQNFVDLTTGQSIAGIKAFTNRLAMTFGYSMTEVIDASSGSVSALDASASSNITLTSASALQGVTSGSAGRMILIKNTNPGVSISVQNESGSATAANRILTSTGGNLFLAANSGMWLSYDNAASRWMVVGTIGGITSLSGDATAVGNGLTATAITFATVNSNVGSFGSSTAIPVVTVNGKGLITAISTAVVIAPAGTLTGTTLASNVVTSSLTSVGTIATGVWSGTAVDMAHGGTNANLTAANGAIPYSTGSAIALLAPGSSGQVLTSGGAGAPTWSAGLVNPMNTAGQIIYGGVSGAATALNQGIKGQSLVAQVGTNTPGYRWGLTNVVSSAGYTVLDTDGYTNIAVSTGASNQTVVLPLLANNQFRRITITKTDTGAGKLIVDGNGTEPINTALTYLLVTQFDSVTVEANASAWFIVDKSLSDISFRVGASGTQNIATVAITKVTAWDTTAYNIGLGWDATNDQFVAPVPGRYYFDAVVVATSFNTTEVYRVWLYLNGSGVAEFRNTQTGTTNFNRVSNTMDLATGDIVDVRSEATADTSYTVGGNVNQTIISGFILAR